MLWTGLPRLFPLIHEVVVQLQIPQLLPYLQSTTYIQSASFAHANAHLCPGRLF